MWLCVAIELGIAVIQNNKVFRIEVNKNRLLKTALQINAIKGSQVIDR